MPHLDCGGRRFKPCRPDQIFVDQRAARLVRSDNNTRQALGIPKLNTDGLLIARLGTIPSEGLTLAGGAFCV